MKRRSLGRLFWQFHLSAGLGCKLVIFKSTGAILAGVITDEVVKRVAAQRRAKREQAA